MIRVQKLYVENFTVDEYLAHPMRQYLQRQLRIEGTHAVENLPVLLVLSKRKPRGFVVPYYANGSPYWPSMGTPYDSCWNRVNMYAVFDLQGHEKAKYVTDYKQALNFATSDSPVDLHKRYEGKHVAPWRCSVCLSPTCSGCRASIDW